MNIFRIMDVETTGLDPVTDRIVEIGYCNLKDGVVGESRGTLVDPGRPIPPEASAIHHITDADVEGYKKLEDITPFAPAQGLVYAAHNAAFDRKFLTPEVAGDRPWICTYRCALRLWPDAPAHNNQTLRYWLKPEGLVKEFAEPSHRAAPDAYVTAHLLREMLKLASVDRLIGWSDEPALLITCHLKMHKGKKWADVPSDYLQWVLRQDMSEDVLFTARYWLEQRGGR
jgi:exodeoxyribonuclease X